MTQETQNPQNICSRKKKVNKDNSRGAREVYI